MNKIICTLKLIRMLWSKKLVREFFLFLELSFIVMVTVATLLPISNAVVFSSGKEKTLPDYSGLIYCSEYEGVSKGLDIDKLKSDFAEKYGENPKVYMTESNKISLSNRDNENKENAEALGSIYMLLISEDLFNDINLKLSEGNFKKAESDILPVIISPNMSSVHSIGDKIRCSSKDVSTFDDGTWIQRSDLDVECEITGILDKDSTVIDIVSFPSRIEQASLNVIGWNIKKYDNVGYIIAAECDFLPIVKKTSAAFAFDNSISTLSEDIKTLNSKNTNTYGFAEYNGLKKQYYHVTFTNLRWRLVVMVLLLLVLFFNYIGYLIMNVKQKQHVLSIMNLCGMSLWKLLLINIASFLLIVIPALLIGLWLAPYTVHFLTHESFYGYNELIYFAIWALFLISTFFGIAAAYVCRKSSSIIGFYKKA